MATEVGVRNPSHRLLKCPFIFGLHYNISKEGFGERIGKPIVIVNGGDHFVPLKMPKTGAGFIRDIFVKEKKMDTVVKQRIQLLILLVGESLSERYSLNQDDVKSLRRSVSESVEAALKQDANVSTFARAAKNSNTALLEALLSHPECKDAFAEHLSETQLQDYIDSIRTRQQQDRQAAARLITGLLGRELSLTTAQHENVQQLLVNAAENESFPTSISILGIDSQDVVNFLHYRLKISLDGILSQVQSEVWQALVTRDTDKSEGVDRAEIFAKFEAEIRKAVAAGEMTERQAEARLGVLKKQLSREDDEAEPQEREKRLAEAKLVAHTELLGTLDENTSRCLTVAIKGALQQYFEAQANNPEVRFSALEMRLVGAVEAGEITREQAAEKFRDAAAELWGKNGEMRGRVPAEDITMYPLYQQTIKEVLSEDAFMQYSAHQTEREDLHQQVLRDRIVANLDTHLLFSEIQRKHLETVAAQLTIPLSSKDAVMEMFIQLPQHVDAEMLSPWQQREFRHIFGEFVMKR